MAESQTEKSKRDQLGERLKKKYPDREYADDEALFGQINDDYDEYEKTLEQKAASEKKLTEMFSQYPSSARFISDMANGKNPWVAIVEELGMDGITDIFENPNYKEELAAAQQKYVDRMSKSDQLEREYEQNLTGSLEMLKGAQAELGLSDEEIDEAVDLLMKIANDAIVGKFSRESFEMALGTLHREADIANARREGETAGRNAKIEEKLRKPGRNGDGVPMLGGRNNTPRRKESQSSIFDIAEEAR